MAEPDKAAEPMAAPLPETVHAAPLTDRIDQLRRELEELRRDLLDTSVHRPTDEDMNPAVTTAIGDPPPSHMRKFRRLLGNAARLNAASRDHWDPSGG